MIIGFISVKGGVGKTTLAMETASSLANDFGKKVLLVDANFSAPNLALHFGFNPEISLHDVLMGKVALADAIYEMNGFDFVPSSLNFKGQLDIMKLKIVLNSAKKRYDFIILDSAPNNREMLPVVSTADKLFVVTTPDHVTLHTSAKAANSAKARKTPIAGIIINKIKNPKYEMTIKDVEDFLEVPVVARIKDDKEIIKSVFMRKPITLSNRNSHSAKEVKRFASALAGEPEKLGWFLRNFDHKKETINRELLRQKFYEGQIKL